MEMAYDESNGHVTKPTTSRYPGRLHVTPICSELNISIIAGDVI